MGKQLNISIDWKEKVQFIATNDKTDYKVYIDTAEVIVGGEKKGTGSKHLFLQAIAGCSAQVVIMMLQKMKAVMPTKFNVDITGKLTDEHPMIFKTIDFTYKFEGETEVGKIKKAIKLSEEKYCGLTFTVAKLGKVNTFIHVNGEKI